MIALLDVTVALYIMLEIRHWFFEGQGFLWQLKSFYLCATFIVLLFLLKTLLLCAIILLLKLLLQLYDILNVFRLDIFHVDDFILTSCT